MARHVEGDDDRRLARGRQQRREAEPAHALDQDLGVLGIAPAAARDAALGQELLERLVEGDDDMDRRREAVLTGLLEIARAGRRGRARASWRCPSVSASASRRQSTKPRPGTPSMHLFEEAATASKVTARESSGSAPKALMASTRRRLPCRAAISAISSIGLRMPLVVSHCTAKTWVIALLALEDALDRGEIRRRVLRRLVDDGLAAGDVEDALGALAVGAVDQHQHLAAARHESGQHRLDREGARALHRHGRRSGPRHG